MTDKYVIAFYSGNQINKDFTWKNEPLQGYEMMLVKLQVKYWH